VQSQENKNGLESNSKITIQDWVLIGINAFKTVDLSRSCLLIALGDIDSTIEQVGLGSCEVLNRMR
jgi:hypothetical protein